MADYYPLLARAIGGLPDRSEPGRRVVYERARRALLTQLRNANPPLRDEDIEREQRSLEEAIYRLEREFGEAPESESGEAQADLPVVSSSDVVEESPPAPAEEAVRPRVPQAAREAMAAPRRPTPAAITSDDEELTLMAARAPARGQWDEDPAVSATGDFTESRSDEAASGRGYAEKTTSISSPDAASRPRRGGLIALALVALVIAVGGVVGYTQRATILALVGGDHATPSGAGAEAPSAVTSSEPEVTKSADRIAQAAPDPSRGGAPATSATAPAGVGVAQRAVMFEESAGGGEQSLQQYVGNVVWSVENFQGANGTGPDIGIRASVTIPDRNVKLTLRLRRNQDPGIPASHIIEVQFDLPPNFDLGNAATVPGMRAKASEGAQGVPLIGLPVRVAPGFFLIGLSAIETDRQRNLGLLITRNFLDLPVVFDNGRRAILVLEKGVPGDQVFREVFAKWGLPVPPPNAN